MNSDEAHLLEALCAIRDPAEMRQVLADILTRAEYTALRKRWSILRLLRAGCPSGKLRGGSAAACATSRVAHACYAIQIAPPPA